MSARPSKKVQPAIAPDSVPGDSENTPQERSISLDYLIRAFVKYGASDLHLRRGRPPLYRLHGKLLPASMPELSSERIEAIVDSVLKAGDRQKLENHRALDLSFETAENGRYRCNLFYSMGQLAASLRRIPTEIPPLETLRLPEVLRDLVTKPRGLFLVTGATGSGKSTTMAALIQYLNENQRLHIITIEDPIEFVFKDRKSVVTQRELGSDFNNLSEALRASMRQDPDVIVLGEMRDQESIQAAMTAAETGHLVLSTLHTKDAKSAVDRILDVFPADQQNLVRVQLASCLVGVASQQLLMRKDGTGRVLASEVMVKSAAIEHCIRRGMSQEITDLIGSSEDYYRMQTMNMDLERLIRNGSISLEEGISASNNPEDLRLRLSVSDRSEAFGLPEEASIVLETDQSIEDDATQAVSSKKSG